MSSNITGSSVTRAQGGGVIGGNRSANTGDGGNGGRPSNLGGNGGSGVVIIAYPSSFSEIKTFAGGLSVTYSGVSRTGFHVYTFTAGTGTVTW